MPKQHLPDGILGDETLCVIWGGGAVALQKEIKEEIVFSLLHPSVKLLLEVLTKDNKDLKDLVMNLSECAALLTVVVVYSRL